MTEKYHSLKVREETHIRLKELSLASREHIYELLERLVKREHQLWQAGYYVRFGDTIDNPYRISTFVDVSDEFEDAEEEGFDYDD
jgi:hypothetical protein